MLTPTATTIALTLATHPFQVLLAVLALYPAGLSFLGSAGGARGKHSNTAGTLIPRGARRAFFWGVAGRARERPPTGPGCRSSATTSANAIPRRFARRWARAPPTSRRSSPR